MRKPTAARCTLSHALAPLALVIGPGLAWGHTPDAPASEVPGDWLWLGALLVASLFALRARRRPRSRHVVGDAMCQRRWLSVAVASLLLFFVAQAPAHTVHHGLDHVNPQECPVLAISDQTNAELPDLLTLSLLTLLPSTDSVPILDLVPLESPLYEIPRTRGPPSLCV